MQLEPGQIIATQHYWPTCTDVMLLVLVAMKYPLLLGRMIDLTSALVMILINIPLRQIN